LACIVSLHGQANIKQSSSKHQANVEQTSNKHRENNEQLEHTSYTCNLNAFCWTFAR